MRRLFIAVVVCLCTLTIQTETIWFFPTAQTTDHLGFVRLINHSAEAGEVRVIATDDAGIAFDPVVIPIDAHQTLHFDANDLELGSDELGISGIGRGFGDWRLEVTSDLDIESLPYIRGKDGSLAPVHDVVPRIGYRHRIPTFVKSTPDKLTSSLRVVNSNEEAVFMNMFAVNDLNETSDLKLTIPGQIALMIHIDELIAGETPSSWPTGAGLDGNVSSGDHTWQLLLTADAPLVVVALVDKPWGNLVNVSTVPNLRWRGLAVQPESRCAGADYERDEYGTRYRSKEDDIIEELGAIYSPYTGVCYDSDRDTDIEHIVAISEAHDSGMCFADRETKRVFAGDILNLTLADPGVNRAKSALDAFDWTPEMNECWFADRVLQVKKKYGMTIDREEAQTLELILSSCDTTEIEAPACAQ